MIGEDLHLAAVVGQKNLLDAKEDLDLDTSWLSEPPASQSTQQDHASSESKEALLPEKASARKQSPPAKSEPTILSVRSQHMEITADGWRLPNGDLSLRRPATAVLDFTPALAE